MYADAAGGLRLWPRCLSIDGSLYMNSLCTFIRYTWIWRSLAWVEALFSMSISVLFSFVSLPRVEMPWQSGNVDVHRLLLSSILLSNVARQRRIRFRLRVCSPPRLFAFFYLHCFLINTLFMMLIFLALRLVLSLTMMKSFFLLYAVVLLLLFSLLIWSTSQMLKSIVSFIVGNECADLRLFGLLSSEGCGGI